jgi:hypothetical protein
LSKEEEHFWFWVPKVNATIQKKTLGLLVEADSYIVREATFCGALVLKGN